MLEIGWNHCGNVDFSKKFVESASKNGATYASFKHGQHQG